LILSLTFSMIDNTAIVRGSFKGGLMAVSSKTDVKDIIVAGDVTVDWNIARARVHLGQQTTYQYIWGSDMGTRACSQAGGAALLATLLDKLSRRGKAVSGGSFRVHGPQVPPEALTDPNYRNLTRSYSVWSAFPFRMGEKRMVWRAAEFWGTDAAVTEGGQQSAAEFPSDPCGLVLDDANLGFRDRQDLWPASVTKPSPKTSWVLAKTAHPVARGPLWETLLSNYADKLTVVVSVSDLRKANMHIGYELSWEQISSEIVQAVTADSRWQRPLRIVVVLGTTGAVVIDRAAGSHVVFDPLALEDNWRREHPGTCIGYGSCYVVSLAKTLLEEGDKSDTVAAVKKGAHAARTLHLKGYAEGDGSRLVDLQFPVAGVLEALESRDIPLSSVKLSAFKEGWTIFSLHQGLDVGKVARDMVRSGPQQSLQDIPLERIGNWSSIDRTEIENIRSLRNIMTEYVAQARPARPLSLAVFGPPGSGKSFAVKEAARGLFPGQLSSLEFNLSQLESHEELPAAFHRVRDCVLKHELPFVFWDEFDTPLKGRELGWLRYFLAPMQDGEFHEGGLPHPLGPSVFVFAGGTHSTMESFRQTAEQNPAAKGRDFLSRLRGFLNILGPNAQGEKDEGFLLRRALLLRSLLARKAAHLFDARNILQVDEGVLAALLTVSSYKHGARSMECLIDMSSLSGKLMFERSCLPARHQLDLHVDADEFLRIVSGGGGNGIDK